MKFLEAAKAKYRDFREWVATFRRERPDAFVASLLACVVTFMTIIFGVWFLMQPPSISLTQFLQELEAKKVTSAEIYNDTGDYGITAVIDGKKAFIKAPIASIEKESGSEGSNVVQLMKEAGVELKFVSGIVKIINSVVAVIFPLIMFSMIIIIVVHMFIDNATSWMTVVKKVPTRFENVAGAVEAKREMKEVIDLLSNSEQFAATGARMPRGVLLSGPPGTGKTMLARAVAGEAGMSFIAVSGSDFQSKWFGASAGRVRALFNYARQNAPCIIFIDEFDAVAAKRSEASDVLSKEVNGILNQLLVQMDGFSRSDKVLVIGATNLVDQLDPAVKRAGRMDRRIEVGLPDQSDRAEILKVHVGWRKLDEDVDLVTVARGTPGFSGAELENLVNEAAIFAVRRKSETLNAMDFEKAKNKIIMGDERSSLVLSEDERRLTAFHEAGHALAGCLTKHSNPVHRATIVPHGRALGMVVSLPERDAFSLPLAKIRDDLVVTMAGRAAEAEVFGTDMITSGAEADIEHATKYATAMVTRWGFSEKIGLVRVPDNHAANDPLVKEEIRAIVAKAYADAVEMMKTNRDKLDAIALALLDKDSLTGNEVRALAGCMTDADLSKAA
jgi:ATP-dependent metalloprotease FtsH